GEVSDNRVTDAALLLPIISSLSLMTVLYSSLLDFSTILLTLNPPSTLPPAGQYPLLSLEEKTSTYKEIKIAMIIK
ncbi:MAG TPA: hypothetical protein VK469_09855, partial [Candidatus Kapabacteria bacterium]|nr:hypothetical protein [Candidatus Kapabacteria bacterium]